MDSPDLYIPTEYMKELDLSCFMDIMHIPSAGILKKYKNYVVVQISVNSLWWMSQYIPSFSSKYEDFN